MRHVLRPDHVLRVFALGLTICLNSLATAGQDAPAFPQARFEQRGAWPVVQVVDAQTLIVARDGRESRVNLAGVALPYDEAAQGAASAALTRMLAGEHVYVRFMPGDARGGYVYRDPDGLLVNLELVRQGYARTAAAIHPEYQPLFRYYEGVARRYDKGIWGAGTAPYSAATPAASTASSDAPDDEFATGDTIVYITKTGKKYHRADCPYAKKTGRPVSLKEAAKKHKPCSRCKPPRLAGGAP